MCVYKSSTSTILRVQCRIDFYFNVLRVGKGYLIFGKTILEDMLVEQLFWGKRFKAIRRGKEREAGGGQCESDGLFAAGDAPIRRE